MKCDECGQAIEGRVYTKLDRYSMTPLGLVGSVKNHLHPHYHFQCALELTDQQKREREELFRSAQVAFRLWKESQQRAADRNRKA